jgi:hypothetical protein
MLSVALLFLLGPPRTDGRGFGGFRGGYGGGYRVGGYSGYRAGSFGGYRGYSGYRSAGAYSGYRGGYGASRRFDRSWTGARGGSISTEGTRGFARGPYGGVAAGGQRSVTATGPGGRTYTGSRQGGVAAGPYGRVVGGGSRVGVATGPRGTVAGGYRGGFAATRFPTDMGLAHYSAFRVGGVGHSTAYWSRGYLTGHAGYIRTGFGYYNSFHPAWFAAHPGCWYPAAWAAGAAWRIATWPLLVGWCGVPVQPVYYDYGNTIVYQGDNVYVDGSQVATAPQYADQAVALADQGQKADPPADEEWKSLGVFALVQGEEKNSNTLFQLAINKGGIIRGNYYDGLLDVSTPVYGSVNKKTQRAAWSIGKKTDRVFETGLFNLTKDESPVLVHFGTDRTQQWLLVRVEKPDAAK